MKKVISSLVLSVIVLSSVEAQINTPPPLPPVATNGVTTSFLSDVVDWFSQGSNFMVVPYGLVSKGDNGKYGGGGGIALAYEVSQYFVTGMRVEYLDSQFYQGSFTGQLQLPLHIIKNHDIVPFVLGGVSVPFGGGTSGNAGTVQGVAGTGVAFMLSSKWFLVGDVEYWSAKSGPNYRGGVGFKF